MCSIGINGSNCDGDNYTSELRESIKSSFKGIVELGGFIGLWWESIVKEYWESQIEKKERIKWVNYHSIIIDNNSKEEKIELYKSIKDSKINKIYIHNYLLIKSKMLLNIDTQILIDLKNWFKYKEEIKNQIKNAMKEKNIILTSMGMGAKVLIYELKKEFPNNIYIDIGSALDLICTKHDSRGKNHYQNHKDIFQSILPHDWENNKYDYIYQEAKRKLGTHIK